MKLSRFLLTGFAVLALAGGLGQAQDNAPHPKKAVYQDAASWPSTAPGQVRLKGFRPFRAVYDRQYTQGSGPGAGEKRQDRVILSAEEVAWDGRRALSISLLDSGVAEHADTNMRFLNMVTAMDDLSVLFEVGPAPGKAKDYYLGRVEKDKLLFSMVTTDTQQLMPQSLETDKAGFGPGCWVMASMKLKDDLKINLAPYYSPKANPISQSDYGRVIGRQTMEDGSGGSHQAWVVETSGYFSLSSPKVLQIYLQEQPPYYLGTEIVNLDDGERKRYVWLRSFQQM